MKWDEITFYSEAEQFDLGLNTGQRTRNTGLNQSYIPFTFFLVTFFFFPHALHLRCALCYLHSVRCLIKAKTLSVAVKHDKNDLKCAGKEVIVNLNGVDSTVRDGLEDIYYI